MYEFGEKERNPRLRFAEIDHIRPSADRMYDQKKERIDIIDYPSHQAEFEHRNIDVLDPIFGEITGLLVKAWQEKRYRMTGSGQIADNLNYMRIGAAFLTDFLETIIKYMHLLSVEV